MNLKKFTQKLNTLFCIFIIININCASNLSLKNRVLSTPFRQYEKQVSNNSDYLKYAKIEFDSCKKITLNEDRDNLSNRIDILKRNLIYKLLNKATSVKTDSIFIEAKKLHAQVNINYAKRSRDVSITEDCLEKKIATKIKREAYSVKYIEKAIATLSEILRDSLEKETVCLFYSSCIEKSLVYVNIGKYFLDAPVPKCLVMCECADFRLLLLGKYNEGLHMGFSILDSIDNKNNNLRSIANECYSEFIKTKDKYSIAIDSVSALIKIEENLKCKE